MVLSMRDGERWSGSLVLWSVCNKDFSQCQSLGLWSVCNNDVSQCHLLWQSLHNRFSGIKACLQICLPSCSFHRRMHIYIGAPPGAAILSKMQILREWWHGLPNRNNMGQPAHLYWSICCSFRASESSTNLNLCELGTKKAKQEGWKIGCIVSGSRPIQKMLQILFGGLDGSAMTCVF